MNHDFNPTKAVIALNQAYLAAAAELCRHDKTLAAMVLHLDQDGVQRLASTTPADLCRLSDVSVALVHPHSCMRTVLGARAKSEILPSIQAAVQIIDVAGR